MNLVWYKVRLTFFITFIVFIVIFLTWTSFFVAKFYKNSILIENKLNYAKNSVQKLKYMRLKKMLTDLDNAQIAYTLWNIVSNSSNRDDLAYKFFKIKYVIITNKYWDIVYQNFDKYECLNNFKCIKFKVKNYNFIFWEKKYELSSIINNIIIFSIFAFVISVFLSLWIYYSINFITRPLEENFEFMKNFINNAWHELKTPLANINLSGQILKKTKIYNEETINDIINESNKLWNLIDTLLNLSVLNKKKNKEKIYIKNMIDDILKKYENIIVKKWIKIQQQIDINTIYWDKIQLQILFDNLIINAIKYNDVKWMINIKIKKWEIIIENTWPSLNKIQIKRMFDIFYRINNTSNWYWLGLAIVKKIIQVNNWKINVLSKDWINKFIINI